MILRFGVWGLSGVWGFAIVSIVQALFTHCSSIVQALFKHCSSIVQAMKPAPFSLLAMSSGKRPVNDDNLVDVLHCSSNDQAMGPATSSHSAASSGKRPSNDDNPVDVSHCSSIVQALEPATSSHLAASSSKRPASEDNSWRDLLSQEEHKAMIEAKKKARSEARRAAVNALKNIGFDTSRMDPLGRNLAEVTADEMQLRTPLSAKERMHQREFQAPPTEAQVDSVMSQEGEAREWTTFNTDESGAWLEHTLAAEHKKLTKESTAKFAKDDLDKAEDAESAKSESAVEVLGADSTWVSAVARPELEQDD